VYTQLSSPR